MKEARFTNHRIFNLRCLKNGVIPKCLKIKAPDHGVAAKKIAETTSRNFLKNRIHLTCSKLESLRKDIEQLKQSLKEELNEEIFNKLIDFVSSRRNWQFEKSKATQQRKFSALLPSKSNKPSTSTSIQNQKKKEEWVINLSSKELSDPELNVLQKGLNFNVTQKNFRKEVIVAKIESCLKDAIPKQADIVRYQVAKVMSTPTNSTPNLTTAEVRASKNLRRDSSITILRADKGNATVVLNTEDYNAKMIEHISTGPYKKTEDQRTVMNKLKAETISLTRIVKPKLDQCTSFYIYPKTNICPRMYGLPKIHKTNVPIRPIVDFTGSPTYAWARYLAKILRPLVGQSRSNVLNSYSFVDEIKNITVCESDILVSYDVVSLYTKGPVNESLTCIRAKLETDEKYKAQEKV